MRPEDFEKAREALENLDDLASGAYNVLSNFINEAEELQKFVDDAHQMHPNLDLDVEYIRKNAHAD